MIKTIVQTHSPYRTEKNPHLPESDMPDRFRRRRTYLYLWISGLLTVVMLAACAPASLKDSGSVKPAALSTTLDAGSIEPCTAVLESSYLAADRLARTLLDRQFPLNAPIMAASLVSIDNLTTSSTFGRMVSEQIASRLAQHGFTIIEIKLRQESVFIKEGQGEFMLSRELKDLSNSREIRAALVGTYAISEHFIFVSARIVRTEDSSVLTGYDYEVPNDAVTQSLLK